MSVDRLKRDAIDAAQKYKARYKQSLDPNDLDMFKRFMDVYNHLSDIGGGGGSQNLQEVTDVGNTTTNTIETAGTKSDYFLLDTLATPTPQQGMLFWDEDRSTVGLQMNGVEARLGQDNFWYVKNQTGSPIPKGTAVMAVGALGASSRILVAPMIADGSVESKYFLGITAEEILNGEDGFVTNIGKIRGIDTSVYGTQAGQILYCDPANPGGFTITQPTAPNLDIAAAFTVDYKINGTLAVRALPGYELNELHDVYINTPSTGQLLRYNTNRWENWTPNFLTTVPTLDQVTTAGNTTANGISIGSLAVDTNLIYTDTVNNRVGIGTNNPAKPLHVSTNNNDTTMGVRVSNDNVGGRAGLSFNLPNNANEYYSIGVDNDRVFKIANASNLTTNTRMSFTPTGNVLIGTTTDAGYKLDVNGTARVSGNLEVNAGSNGRLFINNVYPQILFGKTGTPSWSIFVDTENSGQFQIGTGAGFPYNTFSSKLYISTAGNVGIGTNNPTVKLHIVSNEYVLQAETASDMNFYTTPGVNRHFNFYNIRQNADFNFKQNVGGIVGTSTLIIKGLTGNVLVGTTTDAGYKLDVAGGDARFNGVRVGLGGGSVSSNTVVGSSALNANTTGSRTIAVGESALQLNTTGSNQVAIGWRALYLNSIGTANQAFGYRALENNTTGGNNTAVGYQTLQGNISGSSNVGVGNLSLYNNTASKNTAVGYEAGYGNTSGTGQTALGYRALKSNTSQYNTALGYQAMENATAADSVAVGVNALRAASGFANNAIGYASLVNTTTGSHNLAIGRATLLTNTIGEKNIAIGNEAGYSNLNGSRNVFLGYQAGYNETGSDKLYIGNSSTNTLIYGDFSTGNVSIGSTVDAGYKLNVNGTLRTQGDININNGRYKLGGAQVGLYATTDLGITVNTGSGNSFLGYYATGDTSYAGTTVTLGRLSSVNLNRTNGLQEMVRVTGNYAPTSGTGLFTALQLLNTINQTGGANGITRGLYVNPTLTSAYDYRAIETTAGKVIHQGLTNATHTDQVYYDTTTGELTYGPATGGTTPTLDQVTTAGNTTTNAITVSQLSITNGTNTGFIKNAGLNNYPIAMDLVMPTSGALRFGAVNFDGPAFQGFHGTAPSYTGQMFFDYGSQQRSVAGRGAFFRNASSPSPVTVMKLTESSNVLIGTTTDSGLAKLQVQGEVSADAYIAAGQAGLTIDIPTGAGQTLHFEGGILTSVI